MSLSTQALPTESAADIRAQAAVTDTRIGAAQAFVNSITRNAEVLRNRQVKRIAPDLLKPLWTLKGFTWNADTQRFIAPNGRPVAIDVIKATSEMTLREAQYRLLQQGLDLQSGELNLGSWYQGGKPHIIDAHMAQTALASGGWENTPQSAWRKLGTDQASGLPYHLQRWRAFAEDVKAGRYGENAEKAGFMQRVGSYADAMRVTFERRKLSNAQEEGHTEARRVRGDMDSCPDCVEWELLGWMPIEEMDGAYEIGASVCGPNCHCVIITRRTNQRFVTDDDLDEKIAAATGAGVSDD